MPQLTIRLDEQLAQHVKAHASALDQSVNGWVVTVLRAATDPDLAGSDAERTRARLARAGLLVTTALPARRTRPSPDRVRHARRAAGRGTPLSKLVADARD